MELLQPDVTELLDISRVTLHRLEQTGLVRFRTVGRSHVYDGKQIYELADRPTIGKADSPPALFVKLGSPEPDPDRDADPNLQWLGWHEDWNDARKRSAVRRWWRIANPQQYVNSPLVAVVSGFVVGVWNITAGKRVIGETWVRSEFDLASPTQAQQAAFENRRLDANLRKTRAVVFTLGFN